MKIKEKFDVYFDPGHGWVKVPMTMLKELGIENRISPYSYRRGENAYLEEDCDASIFMKAYAEKYGHEIRIVYHNTDRLSRIRSYPRFTH